MTTSSGYDSVRAFISQAGEDSRVEVNQRALIDKVTRDIISSCFGGAEVVAKTVAVITLGVVGCDSLCKYLLTKNAPKFAFYIRVTDPCEIRDTWRSLS